MPNSSIEEFSVLSPSQKRELERKRQEKIARETAEAIRKAEAKRRAKEAAEQKAAAAQKAREAKNAKENQKKATFWILGLALTALVIWGACKLSAIMIEADGGMIFLVAMGWVCVPFIIAGIWGILNLILDI